MQINGVRQKYICESDSAVKTCEATLFLQDAVYTRTCDFQDLVKCLVLIFIIIEYVYQFLVTNKIELQIKVTIKQK